jgi:multimeric flavodoxin WrbA
MKIAAFVGSPRADGVTDAVVREAMRGAEDAGADGAVFHIGLLHINGCHACLKCRETGECVQDDDMKPLFSELRKADAVILGTPVYFYYMTAQMKAFTDRLFSIIDRGFSPRFGRKAAVLVATQGADDPKLFQEQLRIMREAWDLAGLEVRDTILACGFESAEDLLDDPDIMERAYLAGRELAGSGT